MKVELNLDEILQGALVGVKRMVNAIGRGNNQTHSNGADMDRAWQNHIEGALAEMAVAKYTNRFWSIGDLHDSDVGNWEVRQTPNPRGDLVIRQRDKDNKKENKKFILVRGRYGTYDVVGWIKGIDGMKDEYWSDPTNRGRAKAWFVPERMLVKKTENRNRNHIPDNEFDGCF
jgi:hypothetical protein